MYNYRIDAVRSVYDGDTIRVDLDLGFGVILRNQAIRLKGIDTPEIRGVKDKAPGYAARDALENRLKTADTLFIRTYKDRKGKYGRWLGELFENGENINVWLVQSGFAKVY